MSATIDPEILEEAFATCSFAKPTAEPSPAPAPAAPEPEQYTEELDRVFGKRKP